MLLWNILSGIMNLVMSKEINRTEGYSIDGADDHWTVSCPNCEHEFEYEGFFDSSDKTSCKCGCEFVTTKVWINESHYIE